MAPKIATRSSLEQIAVIDRLLSRSKPTSMAALMAALSCCERTVRRHVRWMEKVLKMRIVRRKGTFSYAPGQQPVFSDHVRRQIGL